MYEKQIRCDRCDRTELVDSEDELPSKWKHVTVRDKHPTKGRRKKEAIICDSHRKHFGHAVETVFE